MSIKEEHYFYVHNGAVLKSKEDLLGCLRNIDDESFNHHVNDKKNDFACWVRDILKDKKLSDNLFGTKSREEMVDLIESTIQLKRGKIKGRKAVISELVSAIKHGWNG